MKAKYLKCSECDYELNPLIDGHCYYVLPDGMVCEDCFITWLKDAVEEDPALFAKLLNIARVEVVS